MSMTSIAADYVLPKNQTNPTSLDVIRRYYPSGDARTYTQSGGVVFYGDFDPYNASLIFNEVSVACDLQLNSLSIEFVTYTPNIGVFVWTAIVMNYLNSGYIDGSLTNTAFRLNQYASSRIYRAIAEIIFCLFILYYSYLEMYIWVTLWQQECIKDSVGQIKAEPNDPLWVKVVIYFYIDPKKVANDTIVKLRDLIYIIGCFGI